jgi:hypothetical protein
MGKYQHAQTMTDRNVWYGISTTMFARTKLNQLYILEGASRNSNSDR